MLTCAKKKGMKGRSCQNNYNQNSGEVMKDEAFAVFVDQLMHKEIVPLLPLPTEDLQLHAKSISERFKNPFIRHELTSIALNRVSKYKARILPL